MWGKDCPICWDHLAGIWLLQNSITGLPQAHWTRVPPAGPCQISPVLSRNKKPTGSSSHFQPFTEFFKGEKRKKNRLPSPNPLQTVPTHLRAACSDDVHVLGCKLYGARAISSPLFMQYSVNKTLSMREASRYKCNVSASTGAFTLHL